LGPALVAGLLLCLGSIPFARPAAAAEDFIAVAATDYSTGKLHTLDPDDPWERHCDVAGICNDAILRWHGGLVYVINRFGCDNIQVLDPEQGFATVLEFSVGAGSNPQGIAFSPDGDKAYVTRQNSASILIVDPAGGDWLGSIDVSPWADADGSPEQGDCVAAGDYVFAALLRLDRD
jgi:streptogramin lyase